MADRVFCIDFGSAYTKVALRRDPTADSELLSWPNIDFCVPSTIAVDRRGTKAKLAFGDEAADQQSGGGIDVHRNWKRSVFLAPAVARPTQSPLEALLQSDDLLALATRYGVPHGQIGYLQQMVSSAKSLIGGPGGRIISAESQQQTIATALAAHFFHWLRQRTMEACAKLPTTGLKFEDIPVRVAVPAFARDGDDSHPGRKLILDALDKAGWPLHPEQPVVAEPYANAIGVLTKGANVLSRNGRLNFSDMFSKGPLITVLKDAAHHPSYRALVIDVGAFTTDFTALTFKPVGEPILMPDSGFELQEKSVPFGVSDLDEEMRLALKVSEWPVKPTWTDWTKVQQSVYSEGKGYRAPGLGKVVGGPADSEAVQACLSAFTKRIADDATAFCEPLEPAFTQELILTGGGSSIPVVREALQIAAKAGGKTFVKTHAPDLKRVKGIPVDKLDEQFTRGGSALGGASIYFEKGYY